MEAHIPGMGQAHEPAKGILLKISEGRNAEEMLKKMIDLELFTGLSSAANYFSAMKIVERYPGSRVLTVFPDSAEKYREAYIHRQLFTDDEYDEYSDYFRKDPSDTLYYGK